MFSQDVAHMYLMINDRVNTLDNFGRGLFLLDFFLFSFFRASLIFQQLTEAKYCALVIYEPHCKKSGFLYMRKQRRRSAAQ